MPTLKTCSNCWYQIGQKNPVCFLTAQIVLTPFSCEKFRPFSINSKPSLMRRASDCIDISTDFDLSSSTNV